MGLREFRNVRRRVDRVPRLGVQSKGRLSLNAAAVEALGHPTHVVLLFDPDEMMLGVRAADEDEEFAYKLTGTGKKTEAKTVSLVALFNHFDVDGENYIGGYLGELTEVGDKPAFVIQLRTQSSEHAANEPSD